MPDRPDPDALLTRIQHEEARASKGRLTIYLGAAPGVGKTFAMLSAARRLSAQGIDVAVGLVETHGRSETERLLRGLEILPRRAVTYREQALHDLDLDAALARRATVLVLDELAHTNPPGLRHEKRWQDVQELLAAGISVHTTLNVQHIESLNDIVGQITGVKVRETVPDSVFDAADEVELVDLPVEALLDRLRAGKVYVPTTVATALESFFRKGNLTALRELALRKTAQWVDARLRDYKQEQGERRIWPASDRLMVCVGPSPIAPRLIRAAHRLASATRAEWFAVHVETPRAQKRASRADLDRVVRHLRLAESLGARTATVAGPDPASAIIAFAQDHNLSRIVLGKSGRARWREIWFGSFTMDVIRASGDIDVHVIRAEADEPKPGAEEERPIAPSRALDIRPYLRALAYTGVASGVAYLAYYPPDLSTEAMVLNLGTALAALHCGRGPSILAALVSAAVFNFLFIEPRFSFSVGDPSYLIAFAVMAIVAFVLSSLVSQVRERAEIAQERQRETEALYSLTRELTSAATTTDVARITVAHLRDAFAGDIAFVVPIEGAITAASAIASFGVPDWIGPNEIGVARWCLAHGRAAGEGTPNLPGSSGLFLPLMSRDGRAGVLALRRAPATPAISPRLRLLIETFAAQAALALDRVRTAEERLRARQEVETERLRSTLLAVVSHDLRTPLTTITGAASSLLDTGAHHSEATRGELASSILEQARRLNDLIGNLMFATRLESGGVELRKQWTSIDEIVGSAAQRAREQLQAHRLEIALDAALPLFQGDPVLLEQAVYLLLENAARHTPAGTLVEVRAWQEESNLLLEVSDDGPGIPESERTRVFQRLVRGPRSAGMGLGLAICAGIFKAHGGRIWIEPGREKGASFRALLPLPAAPPSASSITDTEPRAAAPPRPTPASGGP